jgi:hypothetical protein
MDGNSSDGLSATIVNAARLMRHDGLRLAVSTQVRATPLWRLRAGLQAL